MIRVTFETALDDNRNNYDAIFTENGFFWQRVQSLMLMNGLSNDADGYRLWVYFERVSGPVSGVSYNPLGDVDDLLLHGNGSGTNGSVGYGAMQPSTRQTATVGSAKSSGPTGSGSASRGRISSSSSVSVAATGQPSATKSRAQLHDPYAITVDPSSQTRTGDDLPNSLMSWSVGVNIGVGWWWGFGFFLLCCY